MLWARTWFGCLADLSLGCVGCNYWHPQKETIYVLFDERSSIFQIKAIGHFRAFRSAFAAKIFAWRSSAWVRTWSTEQEEQMIVSSTGSVFAKSSAGKFTKYCWISFQYHSSSSPLYSRGLGLDQRNNQHRLILVSFRMNFSSVGVQPATS